jgi:hypothetical protein
MLFWYETRATHCGNKATFSKQAGNLVLDPFCIVPVTCAAGIAEWTSRFLELSLTPNIPVCAHGKNQSTRSSTGGSVRSHTRMIEPESHLRLHDMFSPTLAVGSSSPINPIETGL